jgi:hypothetical protein
MDRWAGGAWREDYPKPEIENGIVRSIIKRVNPDVLALQEMGEIPYLNDLWRDLNSSGIGNYSYFFGSEAKRVNSDTSLYLAGCR